MRAISVLFVGVAILRLTAAPAFAHHSFAAFDETRQVRISGVVREVQYTNPHAWLFVDIKNDKGETEKWGIEAGGPNILSRQGWKPNTIKPGDNVNVILHPMRDETMKGGSLVAVRLADGRTIGTWTE